MKLATKIALLLIAACAFGQNPNTASFPSAISTDLSLGVGKDNAQTTLASGINASQTNLTMTDSSSFLVYSFITIGSEQMQVCAIAGTAVTACSRGANSTVAAAHSLGSTVRANIVAYYVNQTNAEVKAIETFIGINGASLAIPFTQITGTASVAQGGTGATTLTGIVEGHGTSAFTANAASSVLTYLRRKPNVTGTSYEYSALPLVSAVDYQFSQAPGGSISIGANTVTLTPCPSGVAGADASHYVYLSAGTGTAEAVLLTGGTCTSAASTGTIIFTAANTHSGAWTVTSATGGIQEALLANSSHAVFLPAAGTYAVYAQIYVPWSGASIEGAGSTITDNTTSGNLFFFDGGTSQSRNALHNVYINTISKASGWAVKLTNQVSFSLNGVFINASPNGIQITGSNTYDVYLHEWTIQNLLVTTGIGISIEGGRNHFLSHGQILAGAGTPAVGVKVTASSAFYITDCEIAQMATNILLAPGNGQMVSGSQILNTVIGPGTLGISIAPTGTGQVDTIDIISSTTANHTSHGVSLTGGGSTFVSNIVFAGHQSYSNTGSGYALNSGARDVSFTDCRSFQNGGDGLAVAAGVSRFTVIGGIYGPINTGGGTDTQAYGISIAAGASDNYRILGANLGGNTSGRISDAGTGTSKVIVNNPGIDDAVPPTIASGASIALTSPYSAVFISGTTQITTMTLGWIGRTVKLIFTNASPGGVGTGGNIARTQTAAQNQAISLTFDGTNWY